MQETTGEETLDLTGIHEALHGNVRALFAAGGQDLVDAARETLKRVHANKDGSVVIDLLAAARVKAQDYDRVRLRPIKGRDYVDGTVAALVSDLGYEATVRFGANLAEPKGAVEELSDSRDIDAIFYAVSIIRGNFFRPKS